MNNPDILHVRLEEGSFEKIDTAAAKYGMNRTNFVKHALNLLIGFDEDFYKEMLDIADNLKVPLYEVIQRTLIKNRLINEISNPDTVSTMDEFTRYKSPSGEYCLIPIKTLIRHIGMKYNKEATQ